LSIAQKLRNTNTILYCKKWQETVDFYRHILELRPTFQSDWFIEFQLTNSAHISVADERRATIKSSHGAGITLTLQVDSADEIWYILRDRGIDPQPVKNHAWGARVFYTFDPEGHRLEFWSTDDEEDT